MKFVNIEMLFLIWTIPLLILVIVYGIKKRKNILLNFASNKALSVIAKDVSNKKRYIKHSLVLISLTFMAIALSGPEYGYRWEEVERKGIDIIVAIDCSKSMTASDISPSRLDRAKREVIDLLNMLQGDRIGLVAFSGTAFLQCPLTLDYEAFHIFLNSLSPDFLPVYGTDIAAAITTAISGFNEKDHSEKAVILITDGESTSGDPIQEAEKASKAGIKIFCIGIGKNEGAPIKDKDGELKKDKSGNIILSKLDEDTLKKISAVTGAIYVHSITGDMDLDIIYNKEIRSKMEQKTVSSGRKQIWEDRYQWFLIISLIAIIIELFLTSVNKKASLFIFLIIFFCNSISYADVLRRNMKKGIEAYEKGDYNSALKYMIDAQLEEPDNPEIYYNLGNTYYKLGDFESAFKNYQGALNKGDDKMKEKILYNQGNTLYKKGDLKEAIENYEKALKIDPNDKEAKENLEFAKKMLEKQQKEKQEQDNNKDKEDKKEKEDKKQEEQQQDQKQEQEKNQQQKDKEQENQKQQAKEQNQNKEQDKDQNSQAERMLNRLKDMPGKALIPPNYEKRFIEKDW
ncbi:MAG: VWA domain-containing protein [Desulfobacterales bacterium]|nr:VWA domain-containing protein [Desulfobacterales bacterium]MBF0397629.1 VWA domain-containing protein [Desulfobacterales bacterium]